MVIYERAAESGYVASVRALRGCQPPGETVEEAEMAKIRDATLTVEVFLKYLDACSAGYTIFVKMEFPRVPVLSEKDSSSMPMERMMLRYTLDMRISPSLYFQ